MRCVRCILQTAVCPRARRAGRRPSNHRFWTQNTLALRPRFGSTDPGLALQSRCCWPASPRRSLTTRPTARPAAHWKQPAGASYRPRQVQAPTVFITAHTCCCFNLRVPNAVATSLPGLPLQPLACIMVYYADKGSGTQAGKKTGDYRKRSKAAAVTCMRQANKSRDTPCTQGWHSAAAACWPTPSLLCPYHVVSAAILRAVASVISELTFVTHSLFTN